MSAESADRGLFAFLLGGRAPRPHGAAVARVGFALRARRGAALRGCFALRARSGAAPHSTPGAAPTAPHPIAPHRSALAPRCTAPHLTHRSPLRCAGPHPTSLRYVGPHRTALRALHCSPSRCARLSFAIEVCPSCQRTLSLVRFPPSKFVRRVETIGRGQADRGRLGSARGRRGDGLPPSRLVTEFGCDHRWITELAPAAATSGADRPVVQRSPKGSRGDWQSHGHLGRWAVR